VAQSSVCLLGKENKNLVIIVSKNIFSTTFLHPRGLLTLQESITFLQNIRLIGHNEKFLYLCLKIPDVKTGRGIVIVHTYILLSPFPRPSLEIARDQRE
jgi:hypothetical protein